MNTIILTMAGTAVTTAVSEGVLGKLGKQDLAQLVGISGLSLLGVQAIGLVIKLLRTCKTLA